MSAVQHEVGSRERILATAQSLFASNGFHQTSMAHLASAADVSVGLIYRSFKGKEDIIEAIVQSDMLHHLNRLRDIQTRCDNGDITIEEAFVELFESIEHNGKEALSFEILAEGFRNDAVRTLIGENCARIRLFLRGFARMANPALSEDNLDGAEEFILAGVFGINHAGLTRPKLERGEASRRAATMTLVALRGLD